MLMLSLFTLSLINAYKRHAYKKSNLSQDGHYNIFQISVQFSTVYSILDKLLVHL